MATLSPAPAWAEGLNPEQRAAVEHDEGPSVICSAAGSGKTKAVVARIARLVGDGVDPARILAVTFSKKGADEMNERLVALGVSEARVGTWHSLCLQILREDRTEWASWTIDERDQHKWCVKDALGYKGINWIGSDLGKIRSFIGLCKANLWTWRSPEAVDLAKRLFGVDARKALDAYSISQAALEEKRLLAFDDFLVFVHRHLSDERNRARWAARWTHVLQDEVQDSNRAQNEIARLLCRDHRNYQVIGDTSQAIYTWRGALPEYLSGFAADWGATPYTMHRNYRSGREIVRVANAVIRPAKLRLPVDMVAERNLDGDVRVTHCADTDDEGREVAAWAAEHAAGGGKYSDLLCLVRLNAQSRAVEEQFLSRAIPYIMLSGVSFYERKELKDLLAYLRVALDRDVDGDAVRRCINAPFRYLGARFVERVMEIGRSADGWASTVLRAAQAAGIQRRQVDSAREWAQNVERIAAMCAAGGDAAQPGTVLADLVRTIGYVEWLKKEEGDESIDQSRGANVQELVRVAGRFATCAELLDYVEENQRASKRKDREKKDRVVISTVHKMKGGEARKVWLLGCNETILPHAKGDPEEERRIMYVAITRARDELQISYVSRFATRSGVKEVAPSRFLLDANLLDTKNTP